MLRHAFSSRRRSVPFLRFVRAALPLGLALLPGATGPAARAEPLSRKLDLDFYRDVPSRNLKGLATRSDGRLLPGPVVRESTAAAPAEILWSLESAGAPGKFYVGTGPDGRIAEITLDATDASFTTRDVVKLDEPQVFAVKRLPNGDLLAGTSPRAAVYLIRGDKVVARAPLPVDSVFDLLPVTGNTVLVATGNPGRIYSLNLELFAQAGIATEKLAAPAQLAAHGLTLFGEIRDRNVRRLARLADGRIAAGSAPKGNVYVWPLGASAPVILQENREAEVTDLLATATGELYASIVFSTSSGESRVTPAPAASRPGEPAKETLPPPATPERFAGRSALVLFPANGFPETLSTRANTALYRILRRGDTLLLAGGELGEIVGYDLKARLALTFAGSASSQLFGALPLPGGNPNAPDQFLLLRNNAPGFAVLDFAATGPREAESRRLDLGTAATVGALRFNRLRDLAPARLGLELRLSQGTDDLEGWTDWTRLTADADEGWRAAGLRGRYAKLRLRLADANGFEIDRAALHTLPQNRRPTLGEFRVIPPGYALIPAAEPTPPATLSLSSLIAGPKDDDRRRGFLTSNVVPSPGSRIVFWNLSDPDGDNLLASFSIRRDGDTAWIDLAASIRESYVQFDTKHLPDGVYFTRLVATETAPRPVAERLSHTFETDDFVIDHTPPELLEASVRRTAESLVLTIRGRDALSLLEGIEVVFNNGHRDTLEQPLDGIRDGREETFVLDVPLGRVTGATSAEITLLDAAGNAVARRLTW